MGDGVTYSFNSPSILATTPLKGATRRVRERFARTTSTRARPMSSVAREASHWAWSDWAWVTARSVCSAESTLLRKSLWALFACRPASSADKHAALACASATAASRSVRFNWALRSSFQISSNRSPVFTWSPSWTGRRAICPPILGESLALRQAFTVPARVLATVFSITPRVTGLTTTSRGDGRVFCQIKKAIPATTTRATSQRLSLPIPALLSVDIN